MARRALAPLRIDAPDLPANSTLPCRDLPILNHQTRRLAGAEAGACREQNLQEPLSRVDPDRNDEPPELVRPEPVPVRLRWRHELEAVPRIAVDQSFIDRVREQLLR